MKKGLKPHVHRCSISSLFSHFSTDLSCDHFGRHGGYKNLATKLTAKVTNFATFVWQSCAKMYQVLLSASVKGLSKVNVFFPINAEKQAVI